MWHTLHVVRSFVAGATQNSSVGLGLPKAAKHFARGIAGPGVAGPLQWQCARLGLSAAHEQQTPTEHYRPNACPNWDINRLPFVH